MAAEVRVQVTQIKALGKFRLDDSDVTAILRSSQLATVGSAACLIASQSVQMTRLRRPRLANEKHATASEGCRRGEVICGLNESNHGTRAE